MNKFKIDLNKKYVFIMGAGASKDDKIPIQDEILKSILKGEFAFKNTGGRHVAEYRKVAQKIRQLLDNVFTGETAADTISLEAIFNILETAIAKNQDLGSIPVEKIKQYYNTLIEGIMFATLTDAKLKDHNVHNLKSKSPYTILGRKLYDGYRNQDDINFSFITFNYDICLDRVLLSMYDRYESVSYDVDFGVDLGNYDDVKWFHRPRKRKIYLLRPHGSINWLFCRSCGKVFSKISKQGSPLDLVNTGKCYYCGLPSIEPYIVHPTNNRVYKNKYISQIWDKVEQLLQEADHWCFIGYSMPKTDRYFSYMLSRIYNFRKLKNIKGNSLPEVSVVNINKAVNRHAEILDKIKAYAGNCDISEIDQYFKTAEHGKDVFKRFEVYFSNIKKYECSFKEFAQNCVEVINGK